jgi:DNA-binding LacI/PurR family transcriptional regulator
MTSKEIAIQLGISPATVSLALNDRPGVNRETRKRVLALAQQSGLIEKRNEDRKKNVLFLEYRKNGNGSNQSNFAQIFSSVIEGVERQAREQECQLQVVTADAGSLTETLSRSIDKQISGALVLATEMDESQMKLFEGKNIPVILLDNYCEDADLSCVTINNEQGVELAIRYLIQMGHSNIGYVHVEGDSVNFRERYFGFRRAMEIHGIELQPQNIIRFTTLYGGEAVYWEILKGLRGMTSMPTAFFTDNDIIAIYTIQALREMKLRVPEDVSVIGFDNISSAELMQPGLTTVATSKHELGSCAMNQLVSLMNGNLQGTQRIQIRSHLLVRGSVKELRGE